MPVNEHIEVRIGVWFARWVGWVVRWPKVTTLAMLALTGVSLGGAINHLGIVGDTEALFSQELPFKKAERRYYDAFPTLYENIFVVVDAPTPEGAAQAIKSLAAKLNAHREDIIRAYVPGGGDFFEEHAFLYLSREELEDLADRLAEAQPYVGELSRDGSLRGLASLLGRGIRAGREGDVSGNQLVTIFDGLDEALRAEAEGREYHLSWAEVLSGQAIEADARRRFLLVQPVLHHNEFQPAKRSILRIRAVAKELGLVPENGFQVRVTGDAALSAEELEVVRDQAGAAGIASFILVGAILLVALRSVRLVLSTLLTLMVGLILTAGVTTVTVGRLNMISVSFAVLFIGLGVDFAIHLCLRYRDLLESGMARADALSATASNVGSSIFLCTVTTATGFFAFAPTDFVGVAELGIISGFGMFVSLFCTLTLLPALLCLGRAPRPRTLAASSAGAGVLAALPLRHPRLVRGAAIVLGLAGILLLPRARFDNNPLHVRDPSSESVKAFSDLLARGGSSPWSLNAVAPDLESAEALAERLRKLDVVERVVTVSDYIPSDQEAKLEIIEDVAMFLPPMNGEAFQQAVPVEETWNALGVVHVELRKLLATDPDPEVRRSARSLSESLGDYLERLDASHDRRASLEVVADSMLGSLPAQLRLLEAALSAGHVTLENLPEALLERMVTEDGRVRIRIFPRDDLNDNVALASFVDDVREIVPDIAGSASEVLESGRAVVTAMRQALLAAFVVVTIILLLLWRNLNDTALVLVPLGLAAVFTVAAAVLLDIPFNFADVIVLPLLLGIGVDSGIHLVHRARAPWDGEQNLLNTSTARAVAYSALTTIASFGTLGFASHLGLATLGQLLTLGVSFTILCNLVVLPSLIVLHPPTPYPATVKTLAAIRKS